MRTRLLLFLPIVSALLACSRQSVDGGVMTDNEGEIAFSLSATKAVPDEFRDYILTIRENDIQGNIVVSRQVHDYTNGCYRVPEGRYCVIAENVEMDQALSGAGLRHISGYTEVDVLARTTSIAEIRAGVDNCAIELIFDQSISTAFKDFQVTLSTDAKSVNAPEEGMVSWWMPGTVGMTMTATLMDDSVVTTNTSVDLAVKDYKRLKLSTELNGKIQVDVTADDSMDEDSDSLTINPDNGSQR